MQFDVILKLAIYTLYTCQNSIVHVLCSCNTYEKKKIIHGYADVSISSWQIKVYLTTEHRWWFDTGSSVAFVGRKKG